MPRIFSEEVLKSKRFKSIGAIVFVSFLSFLIWDYYMKITWDYHIVTDLKSYYLDKKGGGEWIPLDEEDLETLSKEIEIPRKLEIIKKGDKYIWASNGNKILTKTVQGDAKKYNIYSTPDESESIKIQVNLYEWGGCDARHSVWTGNLIMYKTLENGDILKASTHLYFYENIIQFLFCYEMLTQPHSIISHLF